MAFLIVADDLTGAADCAVQFRQARFSAVVLTRLAGQHGAFKRFQVVSLSLHTRDASPSGAQRIWRRHAAAIAKLATGAVVYQKIDSTLRGHPAQDVRCLLSSLDATAAVIAPAFPKLGRQTIGGVHLVHGVPLGETEYARGQDPRQRSSRLEEIFTIPGEAAPAHLPWQRIEHGAEAVAQWLQERLWEGCHLMTADAAQERHLDILTQAILPLGKRVLLVGSAGWAERLAMAHIRRGTGGPRHPGTLGVVGSLSHVATGQVQAARQAGATVVRFPLDAEDWREPMVDLAAGRHVVLWTHPGDESPSPHQRGVHILRRLGDVVRETLSTGPVSGLAIVGGDTARAIFHALRASGLIVVGEVAAGTPYGRLLDGPFAGLPTVTKAGGFGTDTALWDCLEFLRGGTTQ